MTPAPSSRLQNGGSYSAIVGSVQAQNAPETAQQRNDNPFKYSKEGMIQVYHSMIGTGDKIKHIPLDFERYDAIASPAPVLPVNATEMSAVERALLAGKITSEPKLRREPGAGGEGRSAQAGPQEGGSRRGFLDGKASVGGHPSAGRHDYSQANLRKGESRHADASHESRRRFVDADLTSSRFGKKSFGAKDSSAWSANDPVPAPAVVAMNASANKPAADEEASENEPQALAAAVKAGVVAESYGDVAPPLDTRQSPAPLDTAGPPSARTPTVDQSRETFSTLSSAGRSTSRLASLGMFDSAATRADRASASPPPANAGPSTTTAPSVIDADKGSGSGTGTATAADVWRDEREEDVLKEAMGFATDANRDEMSLLTDMYQNQSVDAQSSSTTTGRANLAQSRYVEQAYSPLGNLDLFSSHKPNGAAAMAPSIGKPQVGGSQSNAIGATQTSSRGFMDTISSPGPVAETTIRHEQPGGATSRVMVMPDKLKWMYRDPTGQHQGPFSGLEMHDWYKAGFFQPNLLVKREEDDEFEPLSILVRRIGNQREPFLVPLPSRQIAPGNQQPDAKDAWASGASGHAVGPASAWGAAQPPFPQSFPSFGTTLTAEQQNALERRKQEEQYMMHRQREFLQQQQMAQQMAQQRMVHNSMGYNAFGGNAPGPYAGYSNGQPGGQTGYYGQFQRNQSPFGGAPQDRAGAMTQSGGGGGGFYDGGAHAAAFGNAWNGTGPQSSQVLRTQQQDFGMGIFDSPRSEVTEAPARAQSTNDTQRELDAAATQESQVAGVAHAAESPPREVGQSVGHDNIVSPSSAQFVDEVPEETTDRVESLPLIADDSATAAQLDETSRASDSTNAAPAPAPWATRPTAEAKKGMSLKEIQEVEAKRTAQRKVAERQAQEAARAQQAALVAATLQAEAAAAVVPLTWAEAKPSTDVGSAVAPWKATAGASGRKTLAQIQAEEEKVARARLASQQAAQAKAVATNSAYPVTAPGARYADSIQKAAAPDSMWSTVGAGGRVAAPVAATRSTVTKPVPAAPAPPKQSAPVRSGLPATRAAATPANPLAVSPEFFAWARTALRDLDSSVNFEEFFQLLLSFAAAGGKDSQELIGESVYANSTTIDGRRFAEEFVRRRREDLKNKDGRNRTVPELSAATAAASTSSGTSGWSSIVKSGNKPVASQDPADDWSGNFKVKTAKKNRK